MSKTLDHLRWLRVTNLSLLAWDFVSLSPVSPVFQETPQARANWDGWPLQGASTQQPSLPEPDAAPETTDSMSYLGSQLGRQLVCRRENGLRGGSSTVSQTCWFCESQLRHLPAAGAWTSLNCSFFLLSFFPPSLPFPLPDFPFSYSFSSLLFLPSLFLL